MSQDKLLVEVALMPVIIPIIAEPGDKLMVLNGVCIGVSTAVPVKTALPAAPVRTIVHKKSRVDTTVAFRKNIVEVIANAQKPLTASEIASKLPTDGLQWLGAHKSREVLNNHILLLVKAGILKREGTKIALVDPNTISLDEARIKSKQGLYTRFVAVTTHTPRVAA